VKGQCIWAAAVVAAAVLVGCQPDADQLTPHTRPAYSFQGNVDPRFVGVWTTAPAPSSLTLMKDGSLAIVAVVMSPRGRTSSKLDGSWLVSGTDLLIKYRQKGNAEDVVLKYSANLSGDTLKLVQAGNGVKWTYHRKVK
jgi:hypothetical protein